MPRLSVPGFAGPSNTLRSSNEDVEETINYYLEAVSPGTGKNATWLAPTPCLLPFAEVMDSPGSTVFYENGRQFAVIGSTYAEIFDDGTTVARGTVEPSTAQPRLIAQIVSNGSAGDQNLVMSGGHGYVHTLSTNAFIELNTTNFPGTAFPSGSASGIEFMDGYGLVTTFGTREFHISALEDFTLWDPLDVGQRSEVSDNLIGMRRNHREIWMLGQATGEVWYDSGDALFPFAPIPGVFIETGTMSAQMVRVADTIAWLGRDERGERVVYAADGYSPKRISTHAIELQLRQSFDPFIADLFVYQEQGHTFLWVNLPNLITTPCFDFVTGRWHQRALWDPTAAQWVRHPISAMCAYPFTSGLNLAVVRTNGVIYTLDPDTFVDMVV